MSPEPVYTSRDTDIDVHVSETFIEMRIRDAKGVSEPCMMVIMKVDDEWNCSRVQGPKGNTRVSSSRSKRSLRTAIGTEFRKFLKENDIGDNVDLVSYEDLDMARREEEDERRTS